MTKSALRKEVEDSFCEQLIGNAAQRTKNMVEQVGVIGALSKLAVNPNLQGGFKALRDENLRY
ncbi:MAG: hypothetical protein WD672_07540 [Woeseia sp.]